MLEQLVANAPDLADLTTTFRQSRKLSLRNLTSSWVEVTEEWLRERDYVV
jgi:hypothetical protein